jgi:hypothetical protein
LADWLLTASPEKGARILVDAGEDGLTFTPSMEPDADTVSHAATQTTGQS